MSFLNRVSVLKFNMTATNFIESYMACHFLNTKYSDTIVLHVLFYNMVSISTEASMDSPNVACLHRLRWQKLQITSYRNMFCRQDVL